VFFFFFFLSTIKIQIIIFHSALASGAITTAGWPCRYFRSSPSKKINERDFDGDVHSGFFASASCFDEDLSSTGPSVQFQASLNSPRARDVRKNERMQAGLKYNSAGCAALNTCITMIVVERPRTYANIAAQKYGLENVAGDTPDLEAR